MGLFLTYFLEGLSNVSVAQSSVIYGELRFKGCSFLRDEALTPPLPLSGRAVLINGPEENGRHQVSL